MATNSRLSASATLISVGALDDMVVGDDEPVGTTITPEPSERCNCSAAVRRAEETAEERIVEQRIAVLHHLAA